MISLNELVNIAREKEASDIHLSCGLPVKMRIDGDIETIGDHALGLEELEEFAKELANGRYEEYISQGDLDSAISVDGQRLRVHIYSRQQMPSIALRLLRNKIPVLNQLNVPKAVLNLPKLKKGIVLVTGETGSGKSTTLAGILDEINHSRKAHIVTLEDPIEYLFTPDQCIISQREIGSDTPSFEYGLRASLREDPDVIMIGEMRDKETIEAAIAAAETGHLVFGTLHTKSAADSIDRMVQVFPAEQQTQIRLQLSMVLNAVLSQQLIKRVGGGRSLACEVMVVTDGIRNLIREGKTPQISSYIQTSASLGAQTMDQALIKLVQNMEISQEDAMSYASDKDYVKKNTY